VISLQRSHISEFEFKNINSFVSISLRIYDYKNLSKLKELVTQTHRLSRDFDEFTLAFPQKCIDFGRRDEKTFKKGTRRGKEMV
jgi:hypothetical protein